MKPRLTINYGLRWEFMDGFAKGSTSSPFGRPNVIAWSLPAREFPHNSWTMTTITSHRESDSVSAV